MSIEKMMRAVSILGVVIFLCGAFGHAFGMTGQSIQEIKVATSQESLWAFLAKLPGSTQAQIFYGLLLSGSLGMIAHYIMRAARGEITGSLWDYMFVSSFRRTLLALAVVIGMALTAITSNVFTTESGEFVGWLNVLWFGLTNGYASDSVANKGPTNP